MLIFCFWNRASIVITVWVTSTEYQPVAGNFNFLLVQTHGPVPSPQLVYQHVKWHKLTFQLNKLFWFSAFKSNVVTPSGALRFITLKGKVKSKGWCHKSHFIALFLQYMTDRTSGLRSTFSFGRILVGCSYKWVCTKLFAPPRSWKFVASPPGKLSAVLKQRIPYWCCWEAFLAFTPQDGNKTCTKEALRFWFCASRNTWLSFIVVTKWHGGAGKAR